MIQRGVEAVYKVELRIDGVYIGDVRQYAQGLNWTRRRTIAGVDEISFSVNDKLLGQWLQERGFTLNDILRPYALDCRIVRDGVDIVGGYLATLPSYTPNQLSSTLALSFDGYENLLGGVYMAPVGLQRGSMGELVSNWIQTAERRSQDAGKGFGFIKGKISEMASVEYTFDNYKLIKDAISDRADNTSGAGKFDVYWHTDRTYDVIKDSEFGDLIKGYTIFFPMRANGVSASSLSASEASGFASTVIGLGAGDVSSNADENTAITCMKQNSEFVKKYGYCEYLLQDSSVSVQSTLENNASSYLDNATKMLWQPEIVLTGAQVDPTPDGEQKIWIGDRVKLVNDLDHTGMTSGTFRVNELSVDVGATGAETIKPTIERI